MTRQNCHGISHRPQARHLPIAREFSTVPQLRKAFNTENTEGAEKTFERKQEELKLWNFPASHFCAEAAARELHVDFGADGHLIGGVHHVSSGIRADGVTALENAQRAALVELHAQRFQPLNLADK